MYIKILLGFQTDEVCKSVLTWIQPSLLNPSRVNGLTAKDQPMLYIKEQTALQRCVSVNGVLYKVYVPY